MNNINELTTHLTSRRKNVIARSDGIQTLATTQCRPFAMATTRGSGKTKRFFPFHMQPAIGRQKAKAHRIKRKGLALPDDKAAMRAIGEHANATHKRH